jgi:hypothetical protein
MCFKAYLRRIRIFETDYGRNCGWYVERRGQRVAVLTDPRWEDQFWYSYRLEVVTDDPDLAARILTKAFWVGPESEHVAYRNREIGTIAPDAFPGGQPFLEPGRLMMRGLYFPMGEPWLLDEIVLWWRRRRRSNTGPNHGHMWRGRVCHQPEASARDSPSLTLRVGDACSRDQ